MKNWQIAHSVIIVLALNMMFTSCHKEEEKYAQKLVQTLDSGKVMSTKEKMDTISSAVNRYMIDTGKYPEGESLSSLESDLVPAYLSEVRGKDAWNNELHYSSDGRHFTLRSSGEDGVLESKDDIVMQDGTYR